MKWKRILHFYVILVSLPSFLKSIHSIKLFHSHHYGLNNQMNNEYSFFFINKDAFPVLFIYSHLNHYSHSTLFSHNNQHQYPFKSTYIFFSIHSLSHSFSLYNQWKQWNSFKCFCKRVLLNCIIQIKISKMIILKQSKCLSNQSTQWDFIQQ